MSNNWPTDIHEMHSQFGVHEWIEKNKDNKALIMKFLEFRMNFLAEELHESRKALALEDPEEIVDGMIDLCVVAIGTLDAMGVDANAAWEQVHNANMQKKPGVKPGRPNPLGLPDLVKPSGWKSPSHKDNHGIMKDIMNE